MTENSPLLSNWRRVAQACAAGTLLLSGLAGLGWWVGNLKLASFSDLYLPMAPASVAAFVILGLGLGVLARWPRAVTTENPAWLRRTFLAGLGIVALLAAASLVDVLFAYQKGEILSANSVGRMSPLTAILLIANALAVARLLTVPAGRAFVGRLAAATGSITLLAGFILVVWYAYGSPLLYDTVIIPPALTTSLAFVCLGTGLVALNIRHAPWLYFLVGDSLSDRLLRALVPAFALIFFLENALEDAWLPILGGDMALWSLLTTLLAGTLFGLILWRIIRHTGDDLDAIQKARQASEARFRGVVQQSVDGIVMTDEAGAITAWNEAQTTITGLEGQAVFGRPLWDVQAELEYSDPPDPVRREAFQKILMHVLQTGDGNAIKYLAEMPIRRADGIDAIIQFVGFPIQTEKGYVLCYFWRDITRRKKAEEALFWELAENAALSTLYKPLIAPYTRMDEIAQAVLEQAQSLTGSEHGYVSAVDPLTGESVGYTFTAIPDASLIEGDQTGTPFRESGPQKHGFHQVNPGAGGQFPGLWGHALNTRRPFYTNSPQTYPDAGDLPSHHTPLHQFLAVPVLLADELVGQIALANCGRDYTERDLNAVQRLAEYYALAIQRNRSEVANSRKTNQLLLLTEIGRQLLAVLDLQQVFEQAVHLVQECYSYDHVGLFLLDVDRDELVLHAKAGYFDRYFHPNHRLKTNQGLVGWVYRHQASRVANDVHQDPDYADVHENSIPTRSELAIPLRAGNKFLGILDIQSRHKDAFQAMDIPVLETLAGQIAIAIENAHLYAAVQQELAERKQAERSLYESEQRYRVINEHISDTIWLLDMNLQITFVSPSVEKVRGYTPEELQQMPLQEQMTPASFAYTLQLVAGLFRPEALARADLPISGSAELEVYRKDGSTFWSENQFALIRDSEGRPVHILGVARDITERRLAQEALRHERDRAQQYINVAEVMLLVLDTQAQIVLINSKGNAILGYTDGELLGKNWFDTCLPLDQRIEVETAFKTIITGKVQPFEYGENAVVTQSGERRMIAWHNTLLRDGAGQIIGTLSSGEDITERKIAEAALRESEERYRRLFSQMLEGFALHEIVCDDAGQPVDYRFLEINPAFEALTGLKANALLGRTLREAMPAIEDDWIKLYGDVVLTGKPLSTERYSSGLDRWYRLSAYPTSAGRFAVIFDDITDRKRAEQALQRTLKEKDVLLKEIHHRVKNNLQIVNSLLSLHAETLTDPTALQAFQDCQNNVRAIALVHENIYRSQNLAYIDVSDYLPGVLNHLQKVFTPPEGEIAVQVDIQPAEIELDNAIPCGLIATELFTNAQKHAFPAGFSRPGQPNQIWVSFAVGAEECVLRVQDNGVGLPAGFDFQNIHSLGLQLVSMLAEQLRGRLTYEGVQGTVFQLTFPKPSKMR